MRRELCPFHKERTPSLVVYSDGFKCYGCGKAGKLEELGIDPGSSHLEPKYVENLEQSFQYINSLPVVSLRGLSFPSDGSYYYVVWPGDSFYNRRSVAPTAEWKQKYKCPSGVKKPLFHANDARSDILVVVEGEINALSIAKCCPEFKVVSPGGSGDFYSKRFDTDAQTYRKYRRILLIADKDKAGAIACIEAKSRMVQFNPDVTVLLMDKDANDVMVQDGEESLQEKIYTALGMPTGVLHEKQAVQTPSRPTA